MSGTTTPLAPTAASTSTSPSPSQTPPAAPSRLDPSNGLRSSAGSSTNTAAPPDDTAHPQNTYPPRALTPAAHRYSSRRLWASRTQARPDATGDPGTGDTPLNTIGCLTTPDHRAPE